MSGNGRALQRLLHSMRLCLLVYPFGWVRRSHAPVAGTERPETTRPTVRRMHVPRHLAEVWAGPVRLWLEVAEHADEAGAYYSMSVVQWHADSETGYSVGLDEQTCIALEAAGDAIEAAVATDLEAEAR